MKFLSGAFACLMLIVSTPLAAEGDAARGQEKSMLCAACHGADGNSAMAMWPKLAGQHAAYTARQVTLIQGGARSVPEMAGIVAGLSEQDIEDLAAYFESQERSPGVADPALVTEGERIYRAGIQKTGVPACMACHGPAGEGNPLAGYPSLAGQHATYTAKMLGGFRSGTTWGIEDGPSQVMVGVATLMTEPQIEAVASYIQGLYRQAAE